jgi:hypothetical protein
MAAYRINNLPLLHFYTMFELVAVLWYYQHAFNSKPISKWLTVIMVAFPLLCAVNFTFFQSIYQFNTYTRPLEAIIIIVLSGMYLNSQNNFEKKEHIHNAGRWVASGFLIYFCSSLFQFIFSNVVSQHASKWVKHLIWNIHDTFVLLMYICFFLAIQNDRRKG